MATIRIKGFHFLVSTVCYNKNFLYIILFMHHNFSNTVGIIIPILQVKTLFSNLLLASGPMLELRFGFRSASPKSDLISTVLPLLERI